MGEVGVTLRAVLTIVHLRKVTCFDSAPLKYDSLLPLDLGIQTDQQHRNGKESHRAEENGKTSNVSHVYKYQYFDLDQL